MKKEKIKDIRVSEKRDGSVPHRMIPIHVFHNEQIDRWVVLMDCKDCTKMHIFYPFA